MIEKGSYQLFHRWRPRWAILGHVCIEPIISADHDIDIYARTLTFYFRCPSQEVFRTFTRPFLICPLRIVHGCFIIAGQFPDELAKFIYSLLWHLAKIFSLPV